MSSISSYLTANNVVYASAACSLATIFSPLKDDNTKHDAIAVGGLATLAGITAVVVKERSFQSSKWAIGTIGAIYIPWLIKKSEDLKTPGLKNRIQKALRLFSGSVVFYAGINIIFTVGAQIFRHMQQR